MSDTLYIYHVFMKTFTFLNVKRNIYHQTVRYSKIMLTAASETPSNDHFDQFLTRTRHGFTPVLGG